MYISTDSGVTWAPTGPIQKYNAVASDASGTNLIAAAGIAGFLTENVVISNNGGASWSVAPIPPDGWTGCASSIDGTKLVAVSGSGTMYRYSGGAWAQLANSPGGLPFTSVCSSADGSVIVATLDGGGIIVSGDGGANFASPTVPTGTWKACAMTYDGTNIAVALKPGGVYVSTDSGATFKQSQAPSDYWNALASSSGV